MANQYKLSKTIIEEAYQMFRIVRWKLPLIYLTVS